jgi:hypothetical protein
MRLLVLVLVLVLALSPLEARFEAEAGLASVWSAIVPAEPVSTALATAS